MIQDGGRNKKQRAAILDQFTVWAYFTKKISSQVVNSLENDIGYFKTLANPKVTFL
jgi:hypothetical protein